MLNYTGYKTVYLKEEELARLYQGESIIDLKENEYLILTDENGKAIDYYIQKEKGLEKLKYPILSSDFGGRVEPRNPQQYCAIDLLKRKDLPIKLISGIFGSGKDYCMVNASLEALQKGHFEKIIYVRNNVQVKDTDPIGAAPGTILEKMSPYLMPFADHCGGIEGLYNLIETHQLEVIPLAFLRGRSIRNAIIYTTEAENMTKEHIQLLMGRVDEGSELWLNGDIKQRDKTVFEKSKGLETMIERLAGNPYFGYVHLIKSERSKVAALADLLD